MKVIATVDVNLEETPLGTKSRVARPLGGVPVLVHTLRRLMQARHIARVFVLCPSAQRPEVESLVSGVGAEVVGFDTPPPPWHMLVQTARKWAVDGWRGGLGGATCFDEYTDTRLIALLLGQQDAEAVLSVPPAAPFVDPQLADAMVERMLDSEDDLRMVFTQAPPGVAGVLLHRSLVLDVAAKGIPIGWIFSYKPDGPVKDLIFQSSCMEVPMSVRGTPGRLVGDTDRAWEAIEALWSSDPSADAEAIGAFLTARDASHIASLPREVEIELTTDDAYPEAVLSPRGGRVGTRGPMSVEMVAQVAEVVARYDDALVVLGGFGDPLRHPDLADVLSCLRRAGVFGLAIRTTAVDLDEACMRMLVASEVDILNVVLDAWTPQLYAALQTPSDSSADLGMIKARLEQLVALSASEVTVKPVVLPEMTKARQNVCELDDFFDGWLRAVGTVHISGHSHRAGQIEDYSVVNMAPAARGPCRRLRSRCMVLADGRVVLCDQDHRGLHAVGNLRDHTLDEVWHMRGLCALRDAHARGSYDEHPLCASCGSWHRP